MRRGCWCDGRSTIPEILDDPSAIPSSIRSRCYNDLVRTHRWLGNVGAVIKCLRQDSLPIRTILDIGCANGAVLRQICRQLNVEGIGIDLHPPENADCRILQLDAVRDRLPLADVAIAMTMIHHLSEEEVIRLIHNVRRSCRRFIILDLVRHPLPATLFRIFVAPFVHRVTASDGSHSFERAFTTQEMRIIAEKALARRGSLLHVVAPLYIRQIADLSFDE